MAMKLVSMNTGAGFETRFVAGVVKPKIPTDVPPTVLIT